MKGCSQRNTGETYHAVSQPSHREAGHGKFRAAATVATRELPSVVNLRCRPATLSLVSFYLFLSLFSFPFFSYCCINIQPPSLRPRHSSFHQSSIPLTILPYNLISISFFHSLLPLFPPPPPPSYQAMRDLTLINKFLHPRWSGNKVQMGKLISLQLRSLFFCFLPAAEREKFIGKKSASRY